MKNNFEKLIIISLGEIYLSSKINVHEFLGVDIQFFLMKGGSKL
jgi:hypothetical protein